VAVVAINTGPASPSIGAFHWILRSGDDSKLRAVFGSDSNLDSNPDFSEAGVGSVGLWNCFPRPDNDDEVSFIGGDSPISLSNAGFEMSLVFCHAADAGPPLPPGSQLELARVHYVVPPGASPGAVPLSMDFLAVQDNGLSFIGSCNPVVDFSEITCATGTILLQPPGAAVQKIPEGNASNTDLTIPAVNLWLCVAPAACAGPGEGELRVVEHATNIRSDYDADGIADYVDPDIEGTGLANVELGLGAYEFTVEYDNFVIQSVNPCDIVFGPTGVGSARGPVDEADSSSPENADCAPDPGMAAPGTCQMSLVLENLVRFGCVTGGQAVGPTGDMDLASLVLIPHPDLRNDLFPGNSNGVVTVLKDNGCELVDTFGHAVIGSINGGLTPVCGDLAVTVRILEGDINLDCTVDVTDEQMISFRYGAFFGDLFYQKWFDLEPALHDLDIDIKDLQKVFGRDGSNCQAPIPDQPPLGPPAPFG
jgi:hypothetical protein